MTRRPVPSATSLLARARLWLRSALHRPELEADMEDEIRFHLEARTADLMAQGLPAKAAARQARLDFGPVEPVKHALRETLGLRWLDDFLADLRYATRLLRKSPGFTAIAAGSLALAIGANTAIFSVANEMLYARLAIPRPRELRLLLATGRYPSVVHSRWMSCCPSPEKDSFRMNAFTYPIYRQLQQGSRTLGPVMAFKDLYRVNATANGNAEAVSAQLVSGNFYAGMEVRPQLGRPILPTDEGAPGANPVVVLSDGFWRKAFGGSPSVLGKTLNVDGTLFTVIGVNPPGFTGAQSVQQSPELFFPISMVGALWPQSGKESWLLSNDRWWVELMARVRPGVSEATAAAELSTLLEATVRATTPPKEKDNETIPRVTLEDGSQGVNSNGRQYRNPLRILLGMVALVLLLACANTANLMLARASARTREMSVRLALGASRGRVLRQVLTESLLLAGLGGVFGVLLGYLARNAVPRLLTNPWQRNDLNIPFDWRVCGFALAITVTTGILFGLFPAWRTTRSEVNTALKEGSATSSRRRKAWSSKSIVAFQVALSTLLVIASALFLRTLWNLNHIPTGFDASHLVDFDLGIPAQRYPGAASVDLSQRVLASVAAIPGVQGVALSNIPFIAGWMNTTDVTVEGAPPYKWVRGDDSHDAPFAVVSEQFFPTLRVLILRGRAFGPQDSSTSTRVAVVNQTFAQHFFPNSDPLGRRFNTGDSGPGTPKKWFTIIGICGDTHYTDMKEKPLPALHFDLDRQEKELFSATVMLRSTLPPESLAPALRRALQQVDPDLPVVGLRTQQQQIDANLQQERMFAALTSGFGILALLLASVGVYGIMAYTVTQRTNEIGIRLALGAPRAQVRGMVLREAAWLALAGVVAGLAITLALVRLVKSMLYGLQPRDPASLAGAALLLLAIALVAGWIPAARASRVDPMVALRHE